MNTLTEVEKAYLAGLIDGEGCIFISKYQGKNNANPVYSLRVIVAMTDEALLVKWQKTTGVGVIHFKSNRSDINKKNCPAWQWIITVIADNRELLKAIYPYLEIKRDQADTALEFTNVETTRCGRGVKVPKYITDQREYYRLKLMNQKTEGNRQHIEIKFPTGANAQGTLF